MATVFQSVAGDLQVEVLTNLLALPGNSLCADCSDPGPTWVSVNNAVFLCLQCAGIHRSLGTDISQIKSVKLDSWSLKELDKVQEGVCNQFINHNFLESHVPASYPKPHRMSSCEDRAIYIRAKYVERKFLPEKDRPRQSPVTALAHERISSCKLEEGGTKVSSMDRPGAVEFVGLLKLKILSGKLLGGDDDGEVTLASCPSVCVGLGGQVFKTQPGTQMKNPLFMQDFLFSWNGKDELCMEVMDSASFSRDGSLGFCSVDILSLREPPGVPQYLDLPLQEGLSGGSLQVEVAVELFEY